MNRCTPISQWICLDRHNALVAELTDDYSRRLYFEDYTVMVLPLNRKLNISGEVP